MQHMQHIDFLCSIASIRPEPTPGALSRIRDGYRGHRCVSLERRYPTKRLHKAPAPGGWLEAPGSRYRIPEGHTQQTKGSCTTPNVLVLNMLDDAPKVGRYRHLTTVVPTGHHRKLLILLEIFRLGTWRDNICRLYICFRVSNGKDKVPA